jgi:hypothetical protein
MSTVFAGLMTTAARLGEGEWCSVMASSDGGWKGKLLKEG